MQYREFKDTTDDRAIFMEDTFTSEVAHQLGASPGGMAMLSPIPGAPATHDLGSSSSARRARSLASSVGSSNSSLMALMAAVPSSNSKHAGGLRRAFASDLTNSHPADGKSLFLASTPGQQRLRPSMATTATSPLPLPETVSAEAHRELEAERDRLFCMYEHQRNIADNANEALMAEQDRCRDKIAEVIALQSRIEEGKRFIRQIKKELAECKVRALPHHNQPFTAAISARTQAKFDDELEQLRADAEKVIRDQDNRLVAAEDVIHELDHAATKSTSALLVDAYKQINHLRTDLARGEQKVQAQAMRRVATEKELEMVRHDLADRDAEFARERAHGFEASETDHGYIEQLQAAILKLRDNVAERDDELSVYRDHADADQSRAVDERE
jgi:hypothetical protein